MAPAQKTERPLFGLAAFDWLRVKDRSGSFADMLSPRRHVCFAPESGRPHTHPTHGVPRTNEDKRRAVMKLLQGAEWYEP